MIRAWLAVCIVIVTGTSFAQEPERKLIEWGWDEPDTKCIRANVKKMEQYPMVVWLLW